MSATSRCGGFDVLATHATPGELARALAQSDGPLAVFSGGGPTSFAAALELKRQGYQVVVVEKRDRFTRPNVVTLKEECLHAFHELGVLDRLCASEAAILKHYRVGRLHRSGALSVATQPRSEPEVEAKRHGLDPKRSFNAGAALVTPIANLQRVLNEAAVEAGVWVLTQAEVAVPPHQGSDVAHEVTIVRGAEKLRLRPDLIIVAEGARSPNLKALEIREEESPVMESWYFGNLAHDRKQAFVGFVADHRTSSPSGHRVADMAAGLVNPKTGEVNVAVRFPPGTKISREAVAHRLRAAASIVLQRDEARAPKSAEQTGEALEIRWMTEKPVDITNRKAKRVAVGRNVIIAGDSAGSGSPLAGLGASLATSAYVKLIGEAAREVKAGRGPEALRAYGEQVPAYVDAWHQHAARNEETILGERRLQLGGTKPTRLQLRVSD